MANFQAKCAERVENNLLAVSAEEDNVAVLSAGSFDDGLEDFVGNILDDRALKTFTSGFNVIDFDIGEAFGTVDLDKLGVAVDFAAGHGSAVRNEGL